MTLWLVLFNSKVTIFQQEYITFWWNDREFCFVLDQTAELSFYSASSMEPQPTVRHVTPLEPIFALTPLCWRGCTFNSFCFTWSGHEPTIDHTSGEQASQYTTESVLLHIIIQFSLTLLFFSVNMVVVLIWSFTSRKTSWKAETASKWSPLKGGENVFRLKITVIICQNITNARSCLITKTTMSTKYQQWQTTIGCLATIW